MMGLGDSIYCRAILRELAKRREVYSITPWPQLLADTPIKCLRPNTRLRTQARNADRPFNWAQMPGLIDSVTLAYTGRPGTMLQGLCESAGLPKDTPLDFAGPPVTTPVREPYIIVRPSTVRQEWQAASRNPAPGLIGQAAGILRKRGFKVISVADIDPPREVLVDEPFEADETYHKGEFHVEQLLALVAGAAGVVAGVGFALPMALAYQTPLLLVFGGCLAHNGPARVLDPRLDTRHIYGVLPDGPCFCSQSSHNCNKHISGFDAHVARFAEAIKQP